MFFFYFLNLRGFHQIIIIIKDLTRLTVNTNPSNNRFFPPNIISTHWICWKVKKKKLFDMHNLNIRSIVEACGWIIKIEAKWVSEVCDNLKNAQQWWQFSKLLVSTKFIIVQTIIFSYEIEGVFSFVIYPKNLLSYKFLSFWEKCLWKIYLFCRVWKYWVYLSLRKVRFVTQIFVLY